MARTRRGETDPLTGWLYEAEHRGRQEDDYAFSGHLRVAGCDYQVRIYGPQTVRGTAKRRWWLKLSPASNTVVEAAPAPQERRSARGPRS